ncbi:STAS domain-containing protein [Salinisphaera sp. P385]|uniref:STAS domain-containing protein n=1 Tax=Spectribacter acetivorans TaxID=3075603 RepID=A0ABU3B871_9GAMM|nr:STAS domain-containing protein [Salinisphaera sp. P385]MDT0618270.1 STAS domain-containing protein [Salinisphaera sp. P385]
MTISEQHAESLSLGSDLSVRTAGGLRDQLLHSLSMMGPVTLDGAEVARVDAGGLQLLVAFCRDRAAAGGTVAWLAPSAALIEAARLAGLAETLGLSDPTG